MRSVEDDQSTPPDAEVLVPDGIPEVLFHDVPQGSILQMRSWESVDAESQGSTAIDIETCVGGAK
jgi:hypothetical protein